MLFFLSCQKESRALNAIYAFCRWAMGDTLSKLFVNPAALPGGDLCGGTNSTAYSFIYPDDPLHCESSAFACMLNG
jgi:hypothetical protein